MSTLKTTQEYEDLTRYLRMHRPLLAEREIKNIEQRLEEYAADNNLYFYGVA
jgi:hypothetical protein